MAGFFGRQGIGDIFGSNVMGQCDACKSPSLDLPEGNHCRTVIPPPINPDPNFQPEHVVVPKIIDQLTDLLRSFTGKPPVGDLRNRVLWNQNNPCEDTNRPPKYNFQRPINPLELDRPKFIREGVDEPIPCDCKLQLRTPLTTGMGQLIDLIGLTTGGREMPIETQAQLNLIRQPAIEPIKRQPLLVPINWNQQRGPCGEYLGRGIV